MKSIAIVTNGVTHLGAFLKENLEEVLAGYVDIRLYALNALAQPARLEEDVVLWMQKNAEAKRGDEIFKGGTIRERRENLEEQDHKGIQIIQGELTRSDGQFFHAAMGSVLQGCLMEWLSPAWAAKLHVQGVRPYSQYVLPLSKGKALWRLAIWQEEAVQELAPRILQQAGRPFFSRQKQCSLTLQVRQVQALTSEDLERRSEALLTAKALRLRFLTPASVRSQNRYMVYPQWPQLMQGLALRRAAAGWEKPPEGLDWEAGMSLLGYELQMARFELEKVRIPSFQGTLEFRLHRQEPAGLWAAQLLAFGECAGVGIKTALGMGAMEVEVLPDKSGKDGKGARP